MRGMKRKFLSTYEASRDHHLSISYIRHLVAKKMVKAEAMKVTAKRIIWLIDKASLQSFLSTPRTPGPKPKKRIK